MILSTIKKSQFYFIFSFALLVIIGALLLKLPIMFKEDIHGQLSWIDAFFTSTSAVCVNGLAILPLSHFSYLGQILIMLLIQIGGIGIMTMSASIIFFLGKSVGWSTNKLISNITESKSQSGMENMLKEITIYAMIVEVIGMGVLLIGFLFDGHNIYDSLWYSLFYSVSAFCNAGFSPLDTNLVGVSAIVKLAVASLAALGGLGMYAVHDVIMSFKSMQKNDKKYSWKRAFGGMPVTSKLILLVSLFLIIFGMFGIKFSQYNAGKSISYIDALFQAIIARTAGFNVVNMADLSSGSVAITIFLMLIGGAPGSTSGGMKVTTFALVCMALYATFTGKQKILCFKREIPMTNILKAFTIATIFTSLAFIGGAIFQSLTGETLQRSLFEISSAIGGTGLSLGATSFNTFNSKILVIIYMFAGRIGPLTLFLFLMQKERQSHLKYLEEKVIIG